MKTSTLLYDALYEAGCRPRNGSALCPAHEDRSPSLGFGVHRDGWGFVRCHTGCTRDQVLAALGMDWTALAPPRDDAAEPDAVPPVTVLKRVDVEPEQMARWIDAAHRRLLNGPEAREARGYLRSRGVTGDDVRRFRLGFAPGEGTNREPLGRLRSRIVFPEWPWRLEGRTVPGLEARTYEPGRKYQTEGPKRAWGLSEVDPAGPVVLVEGPLDRVAVARLAGPTQVLALCGSSGVKREDVVALRGRGVTEVLVLLDADVEVAKLERVMRDLASGGVRPVAVSGLPDGDPGDLLPALTDGDDGAWSALSEALTVPTVPGEVAA